MYTWVELLIKSSYNFQQTNLPSPLFRAERCSSSSRWINMQVNWGTCPSSPGSTVPVKILTKFHSPQHQHFAGQISRKALLPSLPRLWRLVLTYWNQTLIRSEWGPSDLREVIITANAQRETPEMEGEWDKSLTERKLFSYISFKGH